MAYSENGSHQILLPVSSAVRDRGRWPSAAEFSIPMDAPIRNVTGFDILDASLPNATYLVDSHNNLWSFGARTGGSEGTDATAPVDLGLLTGSRSFEIVMDDVSRPRSLVKVVGDLHSGAFSSAPADATSGMFLTYLVSAPVEEATALDLAAPQAADARPLPLVESPLLQWNGGSGAWVFSSSRTPQSTPISVVAGKLLVQAPDGVVYRLSASEASRIPMRDLVVLQAGVLTASLTVQVTPAHYASVATAGGVGAGVLHEFELHNVWLETGDHSVDTLVSTMKTMTPVNHLGAVSVLEIQGASAVSPANYSRRRKAQFLASGFFWFDMFRSTAASVLGFGVPAGRPVPYGAAARQRDMHGATWNSQLGVFFMETPGVISLIGTPLLRLRCPELEEHLYTGMQGDLHAGIGIFKLYDSQLAHLRFESVLYRPAITRVIPRLTKLTLRFERFDGSLYDFKGTDYHVLLALTVSAQ